MSAIEIKYSLFKDIDSISDERMLQRISVLVKSILATSRVKSSATDNVSEIPDFVRNMSVNTGLSGDIDAKDLMREHWNEVYG